MRCTLASAALKQSDVWSSCPDRPGANPETVPQVMAQHFSSIIVVGDSIERHIYQGCALVYISVCVARMQ